jgi:hypothetical protein
MPVVVKKQWLRRLHNAWRDEAAKAHAELKKQLASLTKKQRNASTARTKKQMQDSIDKKKEQIAELKAVDAQFVAFLKSQGYLAKVIR